MWPRKHKFEVVPPAAEHRRPRVLFIAISFARGVKPFADDLDRERGVVSSRVALSSRSVEIQPLVPKVSPAFMLPPGTPRLPPVSPPAPPLLKCFKVGHLDEKSVVALAWGSTSSLIPPFFFRFFFSRSPCLRLISLLAKVVCSPHFQGNLSRPGFHIGQCAMPS